jgi:hypothetical protein
MKPKQQLKLWLKNGMVEREQFSMNFTMQTQKISSIELFKKTVKELGGIVGNNPSESWIDFSNHGKNWKKVYTLKATIFDIDDYLED